MVYTSWLGFKECKMKLFKPLKLALASLAAVGMIAACGGGSSSGSNSSSTVQATPKTCPAGVESAFRNFLTDEGAANIASGATSVIFEARYQDDNNVPDDYTTLAIFFEEGDLDGTEFEQMPLTIVHNDQNYRLSFGVDTDGYPWLAYQNITDVEYGYYDEQDVGYSNWIYLHEGLIYTGEFWSDDLVDMFGDYHENEHGETQIQTINDNGDMSYDNYDENLRNQIINNERYIVVQNEKVNRFFMLAYEKLKDDSGLMDVYDIDAQDLESRLEILLTSIELYEQYANGTVDLSGVDMTNTCLKLVMDNVLLDTEVLVEYDSTTEEMIWQDHPIAHDVMKIDLSGNRWFDKNSLRILVDSLSQVIIDEATGNMYYSKGNSLKEVDLKGTSVTQQDIDDLIKEDPDRYWHFMLHKVKILINE